MRSRSRRRRSGRSWVSGRPRRRRYQFRARSTTPPIAPSGRSDAISQAVPIARTANAPSPIHVARTSPSATPPPRIAGIANRGIANNTAVIITEAAGSPVATVATSSPACVSIRYCTTPPVAAPPGITLLAALLASCDVAIRNHRRLLREIASTSQTQAKLPASSRTIPTNHGTLIVDRWGQASTVASRAGHTR